MAAIIQKLVSIAANANVPDQLVADNIMLQQRTAQRDGVADVALIESATGLEIDIFIGGRLMTQAYEPVIKSTAPILPDDIAGSFAIRKGEQLSLGVNNVTAGAVNLGYKLKLP